MRPVGRLAPGISPILLLLIVPLLSGCMALDEGNFELKATEIGWNVADRARFALTLIPGRLQDEPTYTIDADFAIEEIHFERKGVNVAGDYRTRTAADVDLVFLVDGKPVPKHTLSAESPTVVLEVTIPDSLEDDTYYLLISLFEVGDVESNAFRVNRP